MTSGVTPDSGATDGSGKIAPSRRAMLLAATAGLVAVAGLAPENDRASARSGPTSTAPNDPVSPAAAPPTLTALRPPGSAVVAGRASGWSEPVRSLSDFHRHQPDVAFAPSAVMLSLDDGPSPYWTPRFLTLLQRYQVTATFFMIGRQVPRDHGLVREVLARGHVIGNHTWTHDEQLGRRGNARIHSEIDRTNDAIHTASGSFGYVPYLFRAPGGFWTPRLLHALNERQLVPVGWDVDPSDWARPGTKRIERTLHHTHPRDVVLCHDGGGDRHQTYQALADALPRWQRRGFSFATLPRV